MSFDTYKIFTENMCTFRETSIDKRDNKTRDYMTDSNILVVNFDDVKNAYVSDLQLIQTPKSVDALYQRGTTIYFVEFKNGYIDKKDQFDVRKKIYDSLLIYSDITKETIGDGRFNSEFILVYNTKANLENQNNNESKIVRESEALDSIGKEFASLGGKEYIKYGLDIFEKYCFKKVHTYTIEEFEDFLEKNEKV